MVRQLVLVRFTEDTTQATKDEIVMAFRRLAEEVPWIRAMRMGFDLRFRPDNFDFGIAVDFDSAADYLAYRDHPAHQKVVEEYVRPVMAERAGCVFDWI